VSIEAYCGLVGGGKSYNVVHRSLEYVANGGCVWSNMHIQLEPWYDPERKVHYKGARHYLKAIYGWELQAGQINTFDSEKLSDLESIIPQGSWERPVLCVLDESLDFLNSRNRGRDAGRLDAFFSLCRHCRKARIDFVFIAQSYKRLNNEVRELCSFIWDCRDMAKARIPGLRIPFPIPFWFLCQQYDQQGKEILRNIWRVKDPLVFGSYRTDEMFREFKNPKGIRSDFRKENEQEKGFPMWAKIVACVAVVWAVVNSVQLHGLKVDLAKKPVVVAHAPARQIQGKRQELTNSPPAMASEICEYGPFSILLQDGHKQVFVNGRRFRSGGVVPEGIVEFCGEDMVRIRRRDGGIYYIMEADTTVIPREADIVRGSSVTEKKSVAPVIPGVIQAHHDKSETTQLEG